MRKIAMIPIYSHLKDEDVFSQGDRDDVAVPSLEVRNHFGKDDIVLEVIKLDKISEYENFIFFNYKNTKLIKRLYKENRLQDSIYVQLEPSLIDNMHKPENLTKLSKIFNAILTWQDDLVDNQKFFKLCIPMPPQTREVNERFSDKKLLVMIAGAHPKNQWYLKDSLYGKRVEAIKFFENACPDEFDLYGHFWKREDFSSYKGKANNKVDTFKNYKFAICFENMEHINGYVTEKIFDCMYANCVPVYWGPDNITKYVPEGCFIDFRKFLSFEKLYDYIQAMSEDEYNLMLENINRYLKSDQFARFLPFEFYKSIKSTLNSYTNLLAPDAKKSIKWLKKYNRNVFVARVFRYIKRKTFWRD